MAHYPDPRGTPSGFCKRPCWSTTSPWITHGCRWSTSRSLVWSNTPLGWPWTMPFSGPWKRHSACCWANLVNFLLAQSTNNESCCWCQGSTISTKNCSPAVLHLDFNRSSKADQSNFVAPNHQMERAENQAPQWNPTSVPSNSLLNWLSTNDDQSHDFVHVFFGFYPEEKDKPANRSNNISRWDALSIVDFD